MVESGRRVVEGYFETSQILGDINNFLKWVISSGHSSLGHMRKNIKEGEPCDRISNSMLLGKFWWSID